MALRFHLKLEIGTLKLFSMKLLFILVRTVTYATLFIGLVLVYLPSRLLPISGITPAPSLGIPHVAGLSLATVGGALALWCIDPDAQRLQSHHGAPRWP